MAEGVASAPAVRALARKLDVETPICEAVAAVLAGERDLDEAIGGLLVAPAARRTRGVERGPFCPDLCRSRGRAGARLAAAAETHLAYLEAHKQMVRLAGPQLDAAGQPVGSLLLIEAEDLAAAASGGYVWPAELMRPLLRARPVTVAATPSG